MTRNDEGSLHVRPNSVRHTQEERLFGVLDDPASHAGRILEITGEPGSGKTRLIGDFAQVARNSGVTVLTGRCTESLGAAPFQGFSSAIAPYIRQNPEVLPPDAADFLRDGLLTRPGQHSEASTTDSDGFTALRAILESLAGKELVIVLDDFHLADRSTLALVDYLIRSMAKAPILVFAQRFRQSPFSLRNYLSYGRELGIVEQIDLAPLELSQSADLLGMQKDDAWLQTLHRESDGIPLYLLALAYSRSEDEVGNDPRWERIPRHFAEILSGELATLDDAETTLATAAAVLGDDFDVTGVAEVAQVEHASACAALSGLLRRDLVRTSHGSGFRFRHPLVRQAVYSHSAARDLQGTHRRALTAIRGRGASAAHQAVHIERSLSRADSDDVDTLLHAAKSVLRQTPETATRWLRAALKIMPAQSQTVHAELLQLLAEGLALAGHLPESRTTLHELMQLLPPGQTRIRTCAVRFGALVECILGNCAEASALLLNEISSLRATSSPDVAELTVRFGFVGMLGGQPPTTSDIDQALQIANEEKDSVTAAGALALRALHSAVAGDLDLAWSTVEESVALVDSLSDVDLEFNPEYFSILGWAEGMLGRYADARRHFNRGLTICQSSGHVYVQPLLLVGLSNAHIHIGHIEHAVRAAKQAREIATQISALPLANLALALDSLCLAWTERTAIKKAVAKAEEASAALPPGTEWASLSISYILALATRLDNDLPRCAKLILDVGRGPDLANLHATMRPMYFEMLTAAAVDADDVIEAERWATLALESSEETKLPHQRAYAFASMAHVKRARGHSSAGKLYEQAAELFSTIHVIRAQSWMLIMAAESAAHEGDINRAGSLLTLANDLAQRCGANRLVEDVREQLAQIVVNSPRKRDASRPHPSISSLTNRELEIAELAGSGKKTREIASQLFLSPRTVDVHLARVYRKLKIGSRAALARLMTETKHSLSE